MALVCFFTPLRSTTAAQELRLTSRNGLTPLHLYKDLAMVPDVSFRASFEMVRARSVPPDQDTRHGIKLNWSLSWHFPLTFLPDTPLRSDMIGFIDGVTSMASFRSWERGEPCRGTD
ncbi:hypothetical protein JB92DRAFT_1148520 [Gautieria morchelliformis]|nr:hypothetical protein JB92DRAFT_1148520 [Gautieria morchelliformis]